MAYEKVTDLSTDTVFALGNEKDKLPEIEGFYLGARKVNTANGESFIHVFQTSKGNVGIWGTKKLNDNLTTDSIGSMMLVVYKNKVKIAGGKTQHTYEFNIDREQTITVPKLSAGSAVNVAQDVDAPDQDDSANDDDQQQALLMQAAERKAKVEALLRGSKNK